MLLSLSNSRVMVGSRVRRNFVLAAAIFAVCFLFNASSNVYAATFTVNSMTDANDAAAGNGVCETAAGNGICTLRAAITEANALAGADIITLPAGTYTQTLVGVEDANVSGDLDITSNITINGAGSGTTFIEAATAPGTAVERVIHFPASNVTAVFNDVTIRNGRQATATFGGGVRVNNAGDNVTFNNCVIRDNFSGFGGGGIVINNATASVTLNNTTVTGNTADSSTSTNPALGGGIFLNAAGATLTATDSTISNNTATSTTSGGAAGAGIRNVGNVTLIRTTVSGNVASASAGSASGGGIENSATGGTTTLTGSTVSGNTATSSSTFNSFGGGIALFAGTFTLTDSVVSGNTANVKGTGNGFAGGIYNQQSTLNLTNSTVSGNSSTIHAGIRAIAGGTAATTNITRSAIVNNTAIGEGGGIVNFSVGAAAAVVTINNSTVGGNMTGGSAGGVENVATSTGNATVNINYSTVAGNAANTDNTGADGGGGLINFANTMTGVPSINLTNSIVADNTIGTGGTGPDIAGVITSGGYNHVENTTGGTFAVIVGDVTGTDPGLLPLALNGGTTLNYKPAVGSPVLDTIPTGTSGCGVAPFDVDQRGFMRPTDSNNDMVPACEKGSVEVLTPTAAMASISGRVLESAGSKRGLANAGITMTDAAGVTRRARTNAFGYFQLADVATGQTYIFDVSAKRYQFQSQVVNVNNDLEDLTFTPLYRRAVK